MQADVHGTVATALAAIVVVKARTGLKNERLFCSWRAYGRLQAERESIDMQLPSISRIRVHQPQRGTRTHHWSEESALYFP